MKILIMGLPGSGKTTLAFHLFMKLQENGKNSTWLNADSVRKMFGDQDFSIEGRLRQAQRMNDLASCSTAEYIICDFIAPLKESRDLFKPDFVIWTNTTAASDFSDTDNIFIKPEFFNIEIKNFNYSIDDILKEIYKNGS